MWSEIIALCCSVFAALWAARELRAVCCALNLEFSPVFPVVKKCSMRNLERAFRSEADVWEAQLVMSLAKSRSVDDAQSAVNSALIDVDGMLSANNRTFAACARIAVFGCLIGVARLFVLGQGLNFTVLNVFVIGSVGVLSSLAIGKEARRLAKRGRSEIDRWSDILLRVRFPAEFAEESSVS